ncbi:hypothetical protein C461_11909 [Halorubrum aidingense JCM 13560]|uniref:DUF8069 domain-containing protein n=1 Tax=Halorubrum aidingense JCM 13560 TaxID=1230454 RepID=M0P906_9EURY|nr:hypothetical protein [Halorubrum aidingense]EMA66338.1 hypothetical protein C461_11909 [Halorubrum aidingense JCM 13560]
MASTEDEFLTQDIYEEKAMLIVEQLLEKGTIEMKHDEPVLHHVPSGTRFESAVNMAHFHKGWEARGEESQ